MTTELHSQSQHGLPNMDIASKTAIETIMKQRNKALDEIAIMSGKIAELEYKIKMMERANERPEASQSSTSKT